MSTKPTRWLSRNLGRRGAFLVLTGLAFLFVGIDVALAPDPPDYDAFLLHTLLPVPLRAALWIVPGLVALWSAWRGVGRDGWGFAALVIPLVVRIVSYIWATVAWLLGVGTWEGGWLSSLIWLFILGFILVVSGWAEVEPPRRRRGGRHNAP